MLQPLEFVSSPSKAQNLSIQFLETQPIGPLGHILYRCYATPDDRDNIYSIAANRYYFSIETNFLVFFSEANLIEMLKLHCERRLGLPFDHCEVLRYSQPRITAVYPIYGKDYLYLHDDEWSLLNVQIDKLCGYTPISSDPGVWLAIGRTYSNSKRLLSEGNNLDGAITSDDEETEDENLENAGQILYDDANPVVYRDYDYEIETIITPFNDSGIVSLDSAAIIETTRVDLTMHSWIELIKERIDDQNYDKIAAVRLSPGKKIVLDKLSLAWNLKSLGIIQNVAFYQSNDRNGLLGMKGQELAKWIDDAYNRITLEDNPLTPLHIKLLPYQLDEVISKTGISAKSATNGTIYVSAKTLNDYNEFERVAKSYQS